MDNLDPDMWQQIGQMMGKDADSINQLKEMMKNPEAVKQMKKMMGKSLNIPINQPKKKEKKIGRNEPCPCDSGKKYKKCCYK